MKEVLTCRNRGGIDVQGILLVQIHSSLNAAAQVDSAVKFLSSIDRGIEYNSQ